MLLETPTNRVWVIVTCMEPHYSDTESKAITLVSERCLASPNMKTMRPSCRKDPRWVSMQQHSIDRFSSWMGMKGFSAPTLRRMIAEHPQSPQKIRIFRMRRWDAPQFERIQGTACQQHTLSLTTGTSPHIATLFNKLRKVGTTIPFL